MMKLFRLFAAPELLNCRAFITANHTLTEAINYNVHNKEQQNKYPGTLFFAYK